MADNILEITFDDVKKRVKSRWEQLLETPEIWKRTIEAESQSVEILCHNPNFEWTPVHETELIDFITKAKGTNPSLLTKLGKIVLDGVDEPSRYNDEENYPFNGTLVRDAIILSPRGQRTDIKHRTNVTSNFQGTIAHEAHHPFNNLYREGWKSSFGWHSCNDSEDWEKTEHTPQSYRNKKTSAVALAGQYTDHPEWCVTDYARMAWDDDYADSGVVSLFQPSVLEALCPQKVAAIRSPETLK
jgi:hypothetical protein